MPTRQNSKFRQEVSDQLKGAGLSPQPAISRARSAVGLLRVYGGQRGVVPDQRDYCGPDEAVAHGTTGGHWGEVGASN